MINNTKTNYGLIHILIHWSMAGIVFFLFASGLYMVTLDYYDPNYTILPWRHKAFGFLLFLLLFFRIFWLIIQKKPQPLKNHRRWEIILSHSTHGLMYLLMLILVCSGYLIATSRESSIDFFGLFSVPALINADQMGLSLGMVHLYAAWGLITLVGLHALGAIKHALFDKDDTLKRMLLPTTKK